MPVGFTSTSNPSSANSGGSSGWITCSLRSGLISVSGSRLGACCVEISTVFRRTARPSSYSNVTCVFPSGRRYGRMPALRTSREAMGETVREPDRQRHEIVGLVARVAEHHSLVAGALAVEDVLAALAGAGLRGRVDALRDVRRLRVDRHHHAARVAVEAERLTVVADAADRVAHEVRDVDVRLGRDLTRDDAQARRQQRLARDSSGRVLARGSSRGRRQRSDRPSCRGDPR